MNKELWQKRENSILRNMTTEMRTNVSYLVALVFFMCDCVQDCLKYSFTDIGFIILC